MVISLFLQLFKADAAISTLDTFIAYADLASNRQRSAAKGAFLPRL